MGVNSSPQSMLVAPASIYLAPVGEAFPDISAAPAGNWALLAGPDNLDEAGVMLRMTQEINTDNFHVLGRTAPLKAARSREVAEIEFTVKDVSSGVLSKALDLDKAVTTTSAGVGVGGNKNYDLLRGLVVGEKAVLVRWNASPDAPSASDDFSFDVQIYRAVQVGSPEITPTKDSPAAVAFTLRALYDSSFNYVKVRHQHVAAS